MINPALRELIYLLARQACDQYLACEARFEGMGGGNIVPKKADEYSEELLSKRHYSKS